MSAGPPHPPGPGGEQTAAAERENGPLSGGTHGILAVTFATVGLALAAAGMAALIAWLV